MMNDDKTTKDPVWRVRVLVVEDDEDLQRIMQMNLEHEGFEVLQAFNGKQGIEMVKEVQPDIVLLDLMMPEMDGFETCKRIKSLDSTREIPVIIVSAKETIKDKLNCFTFQADDYMTKPYESEELAARIYLHLNKVANNQEMQDRVRNRAVRTMLRELSAKMTRENRRIEDRIGEFQEQLPKKYHKSLNDLAEAVRQMVCIVEQMREGHDPLYDSPFLKKEAIDLSD